MGKVKSASASRFRFDLGLRTLFPEWRRLFVLKGLKADVIAGTTVACIAVPLALAIALASGVDPAVGLITAIVASIVCAIFGGTPLGVSGPAAAMAVLIASVVQQFGMGGLLIVTWGGGILQVLTGVLALGRIVRFVPVPVISGFTAGMGAIILIGQLPRALGLPPPDQSHVLDVLIHIRDLFHMAKLTSVILAVGTISLVMILPRFFPRLPAPLFAVLVPSAVVAYFGINADTIGVIPGSLPMPQMPVFPTSGLGSLTASTLIVFSLASLETLLSSSAVDKLSKGKRHDPDQELIGQGLGNIVSSLFGGIPATGVIARSALNIQAGAQTRRAAIFHAFVLILAVYFLAPWIGKIPTAVLAGILLSVALRMLHPREFFELWHYSRSEALIYLITFLSIVFIDLIAGIQAGVVAALVIAGIRLSRIQSRVQIFNSQKGPSQIFIDGPLTFLSSSKIEMLRGSLKKIPPEKGIILDLSAVKSIDASGAGHLVELLSELNQNGRKYALRGLDSHCRELLVSVDAQGEIGAHVAANETEVIDLLGHQDMPGLDRLVYGFERFKRELQVGYGTLFEKLATGQTPHTLFITCSDSRIDPNLITYTDPGELFIIRNVGNIIPPFGDDGTPAEGAAIEYALGVLGVKEIVVCAHSGCGAMAALVSEQVFSEKGKKALPSLARWLEPALSIKKLFPKGPINPEKVAALNCLAQIENIKTYPIVKSKLKKGELRLNAWFYNIGKGELEEWDEIRKRFVTVGSKIDRSQQKKRIKAGVQFQPPLGEEDKE